MTVENCIKFLEKCRAQAENPVDSDGNPMRGDDRKHAVEQSLRNVEMMKNHILRSRKFKGHPILLELQDNKPKQEKEKEDGKKSKG